MAVWRPANDEWRPAIRLRSSRYELRLSGKSNIASYAAVKPAEHSGEADEALFSRAKILSV